MAGSDEVTHNSNGRW